MLSFITRTALRLDLWLRKRLGRPYNFMLGVGLVIEIVRRLMEVPSRMALPHHLIGEGLVIAMELALLLHQVGMLSHHIDNHKALGKPRKSKAGDRELEAAAGDDASA